MVQKFREDGTVTRKLIARKVEEYLRGSEVNYFGGGFKTVPGDTFVQAGLGAVERRYQDKMRDIVSVKDFGTIGVGNDSAVIQAAIDAVSASGGGTVYCPAGTYTANVVLKEGVFLLGTVGGYGYLAGGTVNQTKFVAAATGTVIDTPVSAINTCGVIGINVGGLGAGTACKGIRFRQVSWGAIKQVNGNNFADEAILVDSTSKACVIEDILVTNAVLNRSRAAVIGAVDIHGTDHFLSRIETGISGQTEGTVQSASLFCVAAAIRMSSGFVNNLIGEFSDVGIYVSGNFNRFADTRADHNYGHGFQIVGGSNQFSIPWALDNSQDTTNRYDSYIASGTNNIFLGPLSHFTGVKVPRYAFNDQATASEANKNWWLMPNAYGGTYGTAVFNHTAGASSAFGFISGAPRTLTANSTTPRVDIFSGAHTYFQTNNSNPTTITDFPGGVNGQEIVIFCNDVNTTIQHNGATITTPNAGNVKLRTGVHYRLIKNGVWRFADDQVLFANNVSADNGNAGKTIQARVNEPTQIWNTAITADRAVTLSTTGAFAGAKFRIVRTANCTGAFNLNVGTGPLKAMGTPGSFCDVEYDGAAWFLSAYGVL